MVLKLHRRVDAVQLHEGRFSDAVVFFTGDFPGELDCGTKLQAVEHRGAHATHAPKLVVGLLEAVDDHGWHPAAVGASLVGST
jgi:hypothetical protein